MKQFLKLIQNELYKNFFQKKTIVFAVFIVVCVFVIAIMNNVDEKGDWRKETQDRITRLEENIKESEKNIADETMDESTKELETFTLEISREELEVQKYRLEKGIPENVITPVKFVYQCKGLFFLISLFMIVLSANMIVNEYKWGTIRQLFIKPVSRKTIFWAKYVATIVITIVLSLFLLIVAILCGYLFFHNNSTSIYEVVVTNGKIELENMFISIIQNSLVNMFMACVLNSISICISVLVNNNMIAVFAALGTWIGNSFVGEVVKENIIYKNFIIANISIDGFLPGGMLPYEGATIEKSIIICIVYLLIFLIIGNMFFSKKEVY